MCQSFQLPLSSPHFSPPYLSSPSYGPTLPLPRPPPFTYSASHLDETDHNNKENHPHQHHHDRGSSSILTGMDEEFDTVDMTNMIGQSVAQFHYAANQEDELTIYPGDVINVYDKSDEGW